MDTGIAEQMAATQLISGVLLINITTCLTEMGIWSPAGTAGTEKSVILMMVQVIGISLIIRKTGHLRELAGIPKITALKRFG